MHIYHQLLTVSDNILYFLVFI